MEIFWFSFNAVTPLVLMVALGYFLFRIKLIDERFIDKANKFCFNVAFPVNLFYQINEIDLQSEINWKLYAFVIAAVLLIIIVLMLIVPRLVKNRKQCGALIQGIYRGNFLLMGFPIARNLFGEAGTVPVAMLLPVVISLFNVSAVFVLEYYGGEETKVNKGRVLAGVLTNPLIIGALGGAAFSLLGLELPVAVSRAASDIGTIANPLALVLLGGQFSFKQAAGNLRLIVSAILTRMALIPVLFLSAAVALGFRGPELGAIMVLFSGPSAVSSYIMARNMNCDSDLAGQIVLVTTVLSGLTLMVSIYILRFFQLI